MNVARLPFSAPPPSGSIVSSVFAPRASVLLVHAVAALLLASPAAWAQSDLTNATRKVFRDRVEPHWFAGNNRFWYRVDLPEDGREFLVVDAVAGQRGSAFDHERMAKALGEATGKSVTATKLPIESLNFSEDGKSITVTTPEGNWACDLDSYQLKKAVVEEKREQASEERPEPPRRRRTRTRGKPAAGIRSPDGAWEALVRGPNLYLREVKTGTERQVTYDANPTDSYAQDVERNRAIEMEYDAARPEAPVPDVYWAPDSKHFVAMRTKAGTQRTVFEVESSPEDQLQPKLQSYPYLKPGDDVPIRKPHLFEVDGCKEIFMSDALYLNPWSIEGLRWHTNSEEFTFEFNQRGHQVFRILGANARTGQVRTIVDEECPTFFCYSSKYFAEYVDEREIIWMSERDGWNHLYLYDAASGKVKNQITKGQWVVRGVEKVDQANRVIWFRAGGIRPGQDPYYVQYCRVNFDGTGLTVLTEGDGNHSASFSPDYRFLVDTWSRVDQPPIIELRSAEDGHLICPLEKANATALYATGWKPPERFVAKGRDGVTDIYGIIYRPMNFDSAKKYPIIEEIYAGPQDSYVPKSFRGFYRYEDLASHGFIIVQIDGMGTSNRSKKFHDVCYKNLVDAGLPDRILWISAAAAKYPYLDLDRVGIYGGSAGGQNALGALLTHGDFYKAGAADCGCHDNRMDKIWWNEQWMSWPVGPWYEAQSNVTLAHNLRGKLLLTVGELDRNVDPSSTMQVVNALIKANKDFELIVFPGGGHGSGGSPYGNRRRIDFFVRAFSGQAETRPTSSPDGGWEKYAGNPVLGGHYGTCFDISVLKENNTYRMWFSWRPKASIALVESKDGIHWSEPVVVLGPNRGSGWENDINRPVVIKRGDTYHMWYTGQTDARSSIGYATSADGVTWQRLSKQPVLAPDKPWEKVAVMCPDVLWDEQAKLYRMWYSGGDQYEPDAIGYATSRDGISWTKNEKNPVFKSDPNLAWEHYKVTACQVVEDGGWFLMFYIGFRDVDHAQIGVARSRDGITNWERLPANPIIQPGVNQWDHDACYKPYAIFDGARWLLWYNGRHGSSEQIGLAIHQGEDLGF